jgi:hypothetical protein
MDVMRGWLYLRQREGGACEFSSSLGAADELRNAPERERRDLREAVKHAVAVGVDDVVAVRLLVVNEELDRAALLNVP